MPDSPAWAAQAALYVVVGFLVLVVLPVSAWIGKREVARWEAKLQDLEEENEELREEIGELKMQLMERMATDHSDVEDKIDAIMDRLS